MHLSKIMYWIASYPRSGNTFLRILFKEVYGIYTWEGYGEETPQNVIGGRFQLNKDLPVLIKTHELPSKTQIPHTRLKTIYLVRDGRDAAVSMAFHRCNIVNPGTDFLFNLRTAILAPFGTSFGGWSKHVLQWLQHADIVIRFEDLITEPIQTLQKLEKLIGLPAGDYSKIPSFQELKTKKFSLGSGNNDLSPTEQQKRRENFFRAGQINAWKTAITPPLQNIFNFKHGKLLRQLGYADNSYTPRVFFQLIENYFLWFVAYVKEKRQQHIKQKNEQKQKQKNTEENS